MRKILNILALITLSVCQTVWFNEVQYQPVSSIGRDGVQMITFEPVLTRMETEERNNSTSNSSSLEYVSAVQPKTTQIKGVHYPQYSSEETSKNQEKEKIQNVDGKLRKNVLSSIQTNIDKFDTKRQSETRPDQQIKIQILPRPNSPPIVQGESNFSPVQSQRDAFIGKSTVQSDRPVTEGEYLTNEQRSQIQEKRIKKEPVQYRPSYSSQNPSYSSQNPSYSSQNQVRERPMYKDQSPNEGRRVDEYQRRPANISIEDRQKYADESSVQHSSVYDKIPVQTVKKMANQEQIYSPILSGQWNTIGKNSNGNILRGTGNTIGNKSRINQIVGNSNSIGDKSQRNKIFGNSNIIGKNSLYNRISGTGNQVKGNGNIIVSNLDDIGSFLF